jgi:hypothetical protein
MIIFWNKSYKLNLQNHSLFSKSTFLIFTGALGITPKTNTFILLFAYR